LDSATARPGAALGKYEAALKRRGEHDGRQGKNPAWRVSEANDHDLVHSFMKCSKAYVSSEAMDDKLTPADPSDVAGSIAFALRFNGRKRFHEGDKLMAYITADHIVQPDCRASRIPRRDRRRSWTFIRRSGVEEARCELAAWLRDGTEFEFA
jgi:hypothetical protein